MPGRYCLEEPEAPPGDRYPSPNAPSAGPSGGSSASPGSGPRAVATASRVGNAVGNAVLTASGGDPLNTHERAIGAALAAGAIGVSALGARHPRLLAWPLAVAGGLAGTLGLFILPNEPGPNVARRVRDEGDEDAAAPVTDGV